LIGPLIASKEYGRQICPGRLVVQSRGHQRHWLDDPKAILEAPAKKAVSNEHQSYVVIAGLARHSSIFRVRESSRKNKVPDYNSVNLGKVQNLTDMERNLQGEVAIVTGVSRPNGIGAAISRELVVLGADLFLTGWPAYDESPPEEINHSGLDRLLSDLRDAGSEVEWIPLDLGLSESPAVLLEAVSSRFGRAHILINNACVSARDSIATLNAAVLDRHYAVNTRAPVLLSVEFVRRFGGKGARRIISMTSGQMLSPMAGEVAYSATKAAVDAFTITFASEVGKHGITVNAIDPGPTDTGWMTHQEQKEFLPRYSLGRLGEPKDAARLVAFLASSAADWITGQIIRSRGGFY
jgi:3-oxoacyl-[acyl-carrier protein] reductase